MPKYATVRELKNQTTVLIRDAEKGKAIVVTRRGKPVATLKPFEAKDLEKEDKYPTRAFDALKQNILARHPELAKETSEQARRGIEKITRKIRRLCLLKPGGKWSGLRREIGMVLLDSNIFILDRFFPRDALYPQNRILVEQPASIEAAISAFTLLEVCGAASFRLSIRELESWLFRFTSHYPILVPDAFGVTGKEAEAWWHSFVAEVSENVSKKMTFGDGLLLREAEKYKVE